MTTRQLEKFCRNYAQEMADPRIALKRPQEWDFREVSEPELYFAIQYEYSRENKDYRDRIEAFMQSPLNGKTVRHHLLSGRVDLVDELFVTDRQPDCPNYSMLRDFSLFPLPWLAHNREDSLAYAAEIDESIRENPQRALLIRTNDKRDVFVRGMKWKFVLDVNFNSTMEQIKREFDLWLKQQFDSRKRKSGKASSPPFHKLKCLAALRLAKAGLKYRDAQEFIAAHARKQVITNPSDVLPRYASQGAWHGAVEAAKELSKRP